MESEKNKNRQTLTHVSRMNFPTLISRTSPFNCLRIHAIGTYLLSMLYEHRLSMSTGMTSISRDIDISAFRCNLFSKISLQKCVVYWNEIAFSRVIDILTFFVIYT